MKMFSFTASMAKSNIFRGGGDSNQKDRDIRRKIWIKLLIETDPCVPRVLCDPCKIPLETELTWSPTAVQQ